MKKTSILVLIIGFLFSQNLFADSPLTSTDISKAYADLEIVQLASKTNGILTIELMDYLNESRNPIEFKIAVINELSWDIRGKNNSNVFYEYLKEKYHYKDTRKFLKLASADILICYAYLKAMDDYFNVDDAIVYARKATSKDKKSFTVNIICALIKSQKALDSDDGQVYNLVNKVRIDKSLNKDMKQDAIDIIFEYLDMYKNY